MEEWDETVRCADCPDPAAFWFGNRMLCDECWSEAKAESHVKGAVLQ